MFNSIAKYCAISIGSALILTACASGSKQPQWITTTASDNYPDSQYLSASAQADDQTTADSRALANLSRIFEVAVNDKAMDFSSSTISTTTGGSGEQRQVTNEQSAARSVNTYTNQVLEGAKVVEHWRAETGPHHSLAVLEKAPAAQRLRNKIRELDQLTESLQDYAVNQANNPAAALSALEKARLQQIDREQLNRNLSVVTGSGLPARHSAASLETQIRNALSVLQFDVNATPASLNEGVQSALNTLGAQVATNSAYVVKGVLDTEPVQKKQGWYWLRGSLELSLEKNGEVQAKQRWPLKVSATDKGMVAQRAKDDLSGKLPNYLYQLLTSDKIGNN